MASTRGDRSAYTGCGKRRSYRLSGDLQRNSFVSSFSGCVFLAAGDEEFQISQPSIPDHAGLQPIRTWVGNRAFIAHRQRIVTPEDLFEKQPAVSSDGSTVLVFDGRLDDRQELAGATGLRGDISRLSDSQLALLAWQTWREEAARRMLGDFAVAVFDARARTLWLTVSPQGPRSLFYYRRGSLVAFATTVPPLLAFPGVSRMLDESVVADYLAANNADTERTFFRDIARVCAGTTVTLAPGRQHTSTTWRPARGPVLKLRDPREYVEAARDVLNQVVASRLRCMGDVALQGSGGLDSACVAVAAASQLAPRRLRLVCAVPELGAPAPVLGSYYSDETPQVLELARSVPGLEPEFIAPPRDTDLETDVWKVFNLTGLPVAATPADAWMQGVFSRLSETGIRAYLTGHSGNFTLTWEGTRAISDMCRSGHWMKMSTTALKLGHYQPRKTLGFLFREVVRPHLPRRLARHFRLPNNALREEAFEELGVAQRMRQCGMSPGGYGVPGSREQMTHIVTRNRGQMSDHFMWIRARYGIEPRNPLRDIRMIDFCLSLPTDIFLMEGRRRGLARALLKAAGVSPAIADCETRGKLCPEWFDRVNRRRHTIESNIRTLRDIPLARKLIDFEFLDRLFASWPTDASVALGRHFDVCFALSRVEHIASFLKWAEGEGNGTSSYA
ncbi:MAG TPA: asparagine synthase-related protein [Bryobacteraceae bacterium]|nr:asparagine synthase-related protein [Bryobacteraceae bacterium]